jgi:hypothetical protein
MFMLPAAKGPGARTNPMKHPTMIVLSQCRRRDPCSRRCGVVGEPSSPERLLSHRSSPGVLAIDHHYDREQNGQCGSDD